MRLPIARPRFTVRRLMVAVASLGLLFGLWMWMERRSARFREIAHNHANEAKLNEVAWAVGNRTYPHLDWAARQRALQRKYERAARYPWLPDPK